MATTCECALCRAFGYHPEPITEAPARALKTQDRYYLERLRDRADDDRKRDKGE